MQQQNNPVSQIAKLTQEQLSGLISVIYISYKQAAQKKKLQGATEENDADFAKMMSAPGVPVSTNNLGTSADKGLKVYNIGENAASTTVFITTANYVYGNPLNRNAKPFGDKGFVVFRRGGDGAIYQKNQATNSSVLLQEDFNNNTL